MHDFWCRFANNRLAGVAAAFGHRGDRHIHLPWLNITPCYYPDIAQLARLLIDNFAYVSGNFIHQSATGVAGGRDSFLTPVLRSQLGQATKAKKGV